MIGFILFLNIGRDRR